MHTVQRISTSFAAILLLGGLIFIYQTRRLDELEHRSGFRSTGSATPPDDETRLADASDTAPAVKSPQPGTDPTQTFIAKLKETLATSLTEDQVIAFRNMGAKGLTVEDLGAAANLSKEERNTIRQGLKQYDKQRAALYLDHDLAPAALTSGLAEVKHRQEKWLAAQLGRERYESVLRSDERKARASAEHRAAESVSRISSAADLTESQKDRLYAGFLDINLHPPKAAEDKLVVETFGNLEIGPSAPDLSEDAEKILTPDQLRIYQLQRRATAENAGAQNDLMMGMMQSLMPTVLELLETNH
ncbi:MAG: hypothetical protein V4584_07415 [Verrucomicrobiota bacterium]